MVPSTKREKANATSTVNRAVKNGNLIPLPCERCGKLVNDIGNRLIHAHHEDYDKPLDVVWLCAKCHGKRHVEIRDSSIVATDAKKYIQFLKDTGMSLIQISAKNIISIETLHNILTGKQRTLNETATGYLLNLFHQHYNDLRLSYRNAKL